MYGAGDQHQLLGPVQSAHGADNDGYVRFSQCDHGPRAQPEALGRSIENGVIYVETEYYLVMGVTGMVCVRGLWTGSRSGGSEAQQRCLSQSRRPRCGAACFYISIYVLEATFQRILYGWRIPYQHPA